MSPYPSLLISVDEAQLLIVCKLFISNYLGCEFDKIRNHAHIKELVPAFVLGMARKKMSGIKSTGLSK